MCGILGIISEKIELSDEKIKILKKSLHHRGPDNSNYIKFNNAIFFHNRLSIIDLDKRSNQPFYLPEEGLILVFNGEIYNYLEIKDKLNSKYNFITKSDTEVLIKSYLNWGKNCLNYLSGAFAFCIYDLKKKKAFFARDRFGQKPLFFYKSKNNFFFSSEVKAIIDAGYNPESNLDTWSDYLLNGQTDSSRNTFFKDIVQLLPGEFAEFDLNTRELNFKNWYNIKDKINNLKHDRNLKSLTLDALEKAIKINLRSDVPLSLSLSGGFDSNLMMSLINKKNFLSEKPTCYNISFDKDFSESEYADFATSKYNFKSKKLNLSFKEFIESLKPLIWSTESPTGGLMHCALAKVSYQASLDGNKILLDGTGLDEAFGGYEIHHLQYLNALKKNSDKRFSVALNDYCKNWQNSSQIAIKKIQALNNSKPKTIDGFNLTNSEIAKLKKNDFIDLNENDLEKSLLNYIQKTKIPRNNRLKDRASMAFGVELRLPFLEHDLVELGLSLNKRLFFLNGKSKSFLRYISKGILDRRVIDLKKMSIQSPQNEWLRSLEFKNYILELLESDIIKKYPILDYNKTKEALKIFFSNKGETSFFVWQIINFVVWHEIFITDIKKKNRYDFKFN